MLASKVVLPPATAGAAPCQDSMQSVRAYRFRDCYSFESLVVAAEPVTVVLTDGVEVRADEVGLRKLYRSGSRHGVALNTAISLGWCRVRARRPARLRKRPARNGSTP